MSLHIYVVLLFCAFAVFQIDATYVPQCDEACELPYLRRIECCSEQGFVRGMYRGRCYEGRAYCRDDRAQPYKRFHSYATVIR